MPFMASTWAGEHVFYTEQAYLKAALGVVGSLVALLLWTFKRSDESDLNAHYSKILFLFLGFLVWEFISLFWAQNVYLGSITIMQHASFIVVFFLASNTFSKKDLPVALNVLIIASVIVSVIGLLQYYFDDNVFIKTFFFQSAVPAATFINKNMASHFMVMTLPISLILFLFANKKLHAILYSITFFIGAWYVLYIQARQAYLAVIVELFVFVIFLGLDFWKNKLRSVVRSLHLKQVKLFLSIAMLVLFIIVGNFTNQGWGGNDNAKLNKLTNISVEGGSSRFPLWINTIEMIKDHPFAGVGVDQWSESYPLYYDRASKDTQFNERIRLQRVHNEYIETLANVGLIGYSLLLWALFYIVRRIIRSLSDVNNEYRSIILSSTLGMIGFAVVSFFSFPIQSYLPVFVLMFFIAAIVKTAKASTKSFFIFKDKYYVSAFVVFGLLLYSTNFVYKLLATEHYYQKSLVSYNTSDFNSGLIYSNTARELAPDLWKNNQMNAVFLMKKNRYKEAVVLLERANAISPYNTFSLFNLQTSYEVLGDYNKQISTLRRILEVDGHNVKASSILVRALYKQKKFKEATDEYTRTKLNFEYFKGRSGFGPYHADLAKTALLVGDYKYFGHIYDDLLKKSPTAENYQVYGIVEYQRLGNKKKAKRLFLIALKIDSKIKIPAKIRNDLGI